MPMEVRDLGHGRELRRPGIDEATLDATTIDLDGEFEHESVLVRGADLTSRTGDGLLSESVLDGADLTGTTLHPVTLTDVRVEGCELSNAVLRGVLARRVEIVRCRAVGLQLDVRQASDVWVEGCRLDYASLRFEQVKGRVAFRGCTFRDATIHGDLTGVVFQECDFAGTEFAVSAAKGCDVRSSRLDGARGLLTLRGTTITADQALAVADRLAAEAGLTIDG